MFYSVQHTNLIRIMLDLSLSSLCFLDVIVNGVFKEINFQLLIASIQKIQFFHTDLIFLLNSPFHSSRFFVESL